MPRKKKAVQPEVFVDGHGDVQEVVPNNAIGERKIIQGIYSTRVENPDGTVKSFVIDDDKLFQHVKETLESFERGEIKPIVKKSTARKTKKVS